MITPWLLLLVTVGCDASAKPGGDTGDTGSGDTGSGDTDTGDTDTGDTGDTAPVEAPGVPLGSDVPHDTDPSTANIDNLGGSSVQFTMGLQRRLGDDSADNLVWSPWSLSIAFAQVFAGADGDAEAAIRDAFVWGLPEPELHEAYNATVDRFEGYQETDPDEGALTFRTITRVFLQDGYDVGQEWRDLLSEHYDTPVHQMDLNGDPAASSAAINAWVEDQTEGRIRGLVTEAEAGANRLLLVNAVYLLASWKLPFAEEGTTDADFTRIDGSTIQVPTMSGNIAVSASRGDGFSVIELPFTQRNLVVTLVVPDEGRFDKMENGLTSGALSAATNSFVECEQCFVSLPKFSVRSEPDVQAALVEQGLGPAFGGSYPGINPDLTLTYVGHMAFLEATERGVEAAAATDIGMSDSGSEPTLDPIFVDRPFLFYLRDRFTGTIVFAGRVIDPSEVAAP